MLPALARWLFAAEIGLRRHPCAIARQASPCVVITITSINVYRLLPQDWVFLASIGVWFRVVTLLSLFAFLSYSIFGFHVLGGARDDFTVCFGVYPSPRLLVPDNTYAWSTCSARYVPRFPDFMVGFTVGFSLFCYHIKSVLHTDWLSSLTLRHSCCCLRFARCGVSGVSFACPELSSKSGELALRVRMLW